jgi:DNA-binding HxlR family transcriptional regulator
MAAQDGFAGKARQCRASPIIEEKAAKMDQVSKPEFDRLLFQAIRLRVIAHAISDGGESPFNDAMSAVDVESPDLLSAHVRLLEEAGYLQRLKVQPNRRPDLRVTPRGRRAFESHMAAMVAMAARCGVPVLEETPAS